MLRARHRRVRHGLLVGVHALVAASGRVDDRTAPHLALFQVVSHDADAAPRRGSLLLGVLLVAEAVGRGLADHVHRRLLLLVRDAAHGIPSGSQHPPLGLLDVPNVPLGIVVG